jgi:hypothetical protein
LLRFEIQKSLLFHQYPQRCTNLWHCSLARWQVDSQYQLSAVCSEFFTSQQFHWTPPEPPGEACLVDKNQGCTKGETTPISGNFR